MKDPNFYNVKDISKTIGNVSAYPQRDGGAILFSLPPKPASLQDHLLIAFVGSEADMSGKKYIQPLAVKLDKFKQAYELLHEVNALYHRVVWDEEVAQQYACPEVGAAGVLGLP